MTSIKNKCKNVLNKIDFNIAKVFTKKAKKKFGKIAFIFFGGLGDGVILLPFIDKLLQYYTDKDVYLICNKTIAELCKTYTGVKHIIECENVKNFWDKRADLYRRLQEHYFETAIDLNFSRSELTNGFIAKHINAKEIVGIKGDDANIINRNNVDCHYTKIIDIGNNLNEICNHQSYLESLGINVQPDLNYLKKFVCKKEENYIVFGVGASLKYRQWPVNNWVMVARYILAKTDYDILVCGSRDEGEFYDLIQAELNSARLKNFCGKTSLGELIDLLGNSRFVVANDSGPAHIASSTGVSGVVILGGGFRYRFFPHIDNLGNKTNIEVVCKETNCFGCKWNCEKTNQYGCIKSISYIDIVNNLTERNLLSK